MSTGKQLAGLLLLSTALTFPGVAFAQGTGTAQSGNAAAQPAVETPAEEPINPDDYRGHQLVAQASSIPIATGENEYTRYGFRDLIQDRCAAIIQPDALIMGGITEFMKVAALAQAHDLPIAPHGNQDVHIHLVSAIPNGLILEYYRGSTDPMAGKTFRGGLEVQDEHVSPPERPGMGIELNEEALAQYRVG